MLPKTDPNTRLRTCPGEDNCHLRLLLRMTAQDLIKTHDHQYTFFDMGSVSVKDLPESALFYYARARAGQPSELDNPSEWVNPLTGD